MTTERIKSGKLQAVTESGQNIEVLFEKGEIRILGKEKNKSKVTSKIEYPEGTIDSLMPLLRPALNEYGVDVEDSFWVDIDQRATMTTKQACNKLKRARVGYIKATEAIVNHPIIVEKIKRSNFFGDSTEQTVKSFVSSLLNVVHKEYIRKD
jgi:hypothetical protein